MSKLAARLDQAIRAVLPALVSVSIVDDADKATWRVSPDTLQAQAQPIIDAFTVAEPLTRAPVVTGAYRGVLDADPTTPTEGDLWIVRQSFPTQRRLLKFRDGDTTRIISILVL